MRACTSKLVLFVCVTAPASALFAQDLPVATKQAIRQAPETNHWDLGLTTSDADLSPDDRLLAVASESRPAAEKASVQIVESVDVWDYRQHEKIASAQLATYAVRARQKHNPVRFTADAALLVVAERTKLHVLDPATLELIRLIEPTLAPDFEIRALETSPVGHVAIVSADHDLFGELFAYDLDTGSLLLEWKPPAAVRSISWNPDGTLFAVAAPFPCTSFGDNVIVFSTNPWVHLRTLTARNAQSLAFSNDRLYSVQTSFCKGSVFNRHLGMDVFDIHGWRRRGTIFLPNKDIHDSVSFAGGRLLANTGAVKTEYDWSDGTTLASNTDAQFTVWQGDVQSVLFASQPLPIQRGGLRLSRTGKMVLVNPEHPQVFQIP